MLRHSIAVAWMQIEEKNEQKSRRIDFNCYVEAKTERCGVYSID